MMRKATGRISVVAGLAIVGVLGAWMPMAAATKGDPDHKVTICHATASAKNPYVVISVDRPARGDHYRHRRSGVNEGDIIPPFDIAGHVYAGNNWDAAHQAIFAADCGTPPSTTSTPTSEPQNA
jgi:hypothetical protein